jgi:multidrug efflux pump subunit AcrB
MKLNDAKIKHQLQDITDLKIKGQMGNMVPVSDLVKVQRDRITENHLQKRPKKGSVCIGRYGRRFRKSSVCNS